MANDNNRSNDNSHGARGFQNMDPEKRRQVASQGGKAAHESGNAHQFDTESGREAGRAGGLSRGSNRQEDEAA